MQAPHLELGREVEQAASEYFLRQVPGARLLERNCRFRCGEIDLVFELPGGRPDGPGRGRRAGGAELVFVEVRARSAGGLALGFETIRGRKQARLRRAIRQFLARYRGRAKSLRVDVLSWDSGEWTHLENVWL